MGSARVEDFGTPATPATPAKRWIITTDSPEDIDGRRMLTCVDLLNGFSAAHDSFALAKDIDALVDYYQTAYNSLRTGGQQA
jgi:hypothetical protein